MTGVNRDSEHIAETHKRVRRVETRLMNLGAALGVDLGDSDKIIVDVPKATVHLKVLDVSFSRVIKQAKFAGLGGRTVRIVFEGTEIGSMNMKP